MPAFSGTAFSATQVSGKPTVKVNVQPRAQSSFYALDVPFGAHRADSEPHLPIRASRRGLGCCASDLH
eukprot:15454950-Alexandrium_andersonii.AAC.1